MAKKLKYLMIHCTATPEGREITKKNIEDWHIKERGWSRVGYSDMIHLDGTLENLIPFNQDDIVDPWEISNGAKGMNSFCRHIVYVGGCDNKMKPKRTLTSSQLQALEIYIRYTIARHPDVLICGHNDFANKACPSFNVIELCERLSIPEKNIYRKN